MVPQKQWFLLKTVSKPLEPERVGPPRPFVLARWPSEAQKVWPRPGRLPDPVTELAKQNGLLREHVKQKVGVVKAPETDALKLVALRPPVAVLEPLNEEQLVAKSPQKRDRGDPKEATRKKAVYEKEQCVDPSEKF